MQPSPTAAEQPDRVRGLMTAVVMIAATACVAFAIWMLGTSQRDPYVKASLELEGARDHGGQLFRINCAGCHGLAGQGLVGPRLSGVTDRKNDAELVHQIISGDTPPMPSFQIEPQSMADLIAYLHKIS